jgi:hypothetical protein
MRAPAILALVVLAATASAQYCPICGTNPCRAVALQKGIVLKEPPPPDLRLNPDQNTTLARAMADLANNARSAAKDFLASLGRAKPVGLVDQIENLAAAREELKNPTTVESWAEAVKIDQYQTVFQNILRGRPPGKSFLVTKTKQLDTRIDQYFRILERDVKTVLRLGDPPPVAPSPDAVQSAQETELREKTLAFMVDAYFEAGMHEQAKALYDAAIARWGRLTNASAREMTEWKVKDCESAIASTKPLATATPIRHGKSSMVAIRPNGLRGEEQFVINFGGDKSGGTYFLRLDIGSTDRPNPFQFPQEDDAILSPQWPNGTAFTVNVSNLTNRLTVNGVGLDLPADYDGNEMNALKVVWFESGIELYLNGQKLCSTSVPRGVAEWQRMNVHASVEGLSRLPVSIRFRVR